MAGLNWLKVDASIFDHPKTRRLARALGISPEQTVGHLIRLWSWGLRISPDGVLRNADAVDLAEAANFSGDAEMFLEALLTCSSGGVGFMERTEDGFLAFHDWTEYSGALEQKREKNRDRMREVRKNKKTTGGENADSDEDDQTQDENVRARATHKNAQDKNVRARAEMCDARATMCTLREEKRREEKNREEKNREEYKNIRPFEPIVKQSGGADFEREFEKLWSVYPRKEGKAAAMKSFIAHRQAGVPFEEIAAGLKNYLARVKGECTEARYIKMGSTFFGPNACWRDYLTSPSSGYGGMSEPQGPAEFEHEKDFIRQNFGGDTNAYAKWLSAGSPDPAGEWYRRFCDNVSRRHHSEDPA